MGTLANLTRWMVAVPAGLLFALCVVGNWSCLLGVILGRLKSTSLVLPYLGPAFGIVCLLAVPIPGIKRYWWIAPVLEPTWLLGGWLLLTAMFKRLGGVQNAFDKADDANPRD